MKRIQDITTVADVGEAALGRLYEAVDEVIAAWCESEGVAGSVADWYSLYRAVPEEVDRALGGAPHD